MPASTPVGSPRPTWPRSPPGAGATRSANPKAQVARDDDPAALLDEPYLVAPLRRHDCPPITDGAVALVLAAGDRAREVCERPAWIRGIDHRIETHQLGSRDLTVSASTELAGRHANVSDGPVDVAELHAPFSHQELLLRQALGLGDDVRINPSGGALGGEPAHGGRPAAHRGGGPGHLHRVGGPGRGARHLRPLPATESRLRPGG